MPDPEVSDNTPAEDPERRKAVLGQIALPNPFAQINGLPPVTPLTVTNPSMAAARYSAPPVAAPSSPSAPAPQPAMGGLPPVQTSPEDQRVKTAQQKLAELQTKPSLEQRTTDWGARHGILGKIGAGVLRGVETAGEVIAPGIASAIPGSMVNLAGQRAAAGQEVQQAEQGAARAATTAHTKAETKKTEAETEQVGAVKEEPAGKTVETGDGVMQWNPDTKRYDIKVGDAKEKPEAGVKTVETGNGVMQWNPETNRYDIPVGPPKAKAENEKEKDIADYLEEHGLPNTAANREKARNAIAQRGKQEPGNYTPVNDAKGNVIGWVDPKSGHVRSAASIPGMGSLTGGTAAIPPKPTQQMRNVGAQAQVAVEGIPGVLKEIDDLKGELGPMSGRWNEFMQGKVGMDNPKFAGLRADLLMLSSAVALAHARGRLPENLREEFDHALNAPKQDPENLKATIQHVQTWMQRMTTIGTGESEPPAATGGPPAGATMKVPGSDGKLHWSDGKRDLGVAQ